MYCVTHKLRLRHTCPCVCARADSERGIAPGRQDAFYYGHTHPTPSELAVGETGACSVVHSTIDACSVVHIAPLAQLLC